MAHKELEDYTREDAMTHLHSMFNVINKLQKDYDNRGMYLRVYQVLFWIGLMLIIIL